MLAFGMTELLLRSTHMPRGSAPLLLGLSHRCLISGRHKDCLRDISSIQTSAIWRDHLIAKCSQGGLLKDALRGHGPARNSCSSSVQALHRLSRRLAWTRPCRSLQSESSFRKASRSVSTFSIIILKHSPEKRMGPLLAPVSTCTDRLARFC